MKTEVTYSCGHDGVVDLYGKKDQRNRQLYACEHYKVCPECNAARIANERAVAEKSAKENNLPELCGTDKQVAWALSIREAQLKVISDAYRHNCAKAEEIIKSETATVSDKDKARTTLRRFDIAIEIIRGKRNASWWIDARSASARALLGLVWDEIIKREAAAVEDDDIDAISSKAEATITPETKLKDSVVEVNFNDNHVTAKYQRDDQFISIVRSLGYYWNKDARFWEMKIGFKTGRAIDRAAELGNKLLLNGYAVIIYDAEARERAVAADFEPMNTRWISCLSGDEYAGKLAISFAKGDNLYDAARGIRGSKWRSPYVLVPIENYDLVLDFADIHGFSISPEASKRIASYRDSMMPPVSPSMPLADEPKEDKLSKILNSSREILEDLRDETDI